MAGSWTMPSSSSNAHAANAVATATPTITNATITQDHQRRFVLPTSDDGPLPGTTATFPIQP